MSQVEAVKRKVGLALGSGGARGLAHAGVLSVLKEEGIPIDLIAGTSAGSIFGAIYAANLDIEAAKKHALEMNWRSAAIIDPSLFKSGLIKGKRLEGLLATFMGGDIDFSDLKIPFACVCTDIDSGEEVIINEGSVPDAVRASISIPAIFTVVKREGRRLVDGGLTTPVPVHVVKQMGADFIIAVNVMPEVSGRALKPQRAPTEPQKEPGILHIVLQSIFITTYSLSQTSMKGADIIIEPNLKNIGAGDFLKVSEIIKLGEQAAQKAIPEIKRLLKNL